MSRLIDADALRELFAETISAIAKRPEMDGNLEYMVRSSAMAIKMIDDQPTVDAVPWEFLERYAEWFCAMVSFPEFIREAKQFYLDAERYERWCNK